MTAQEQKRARAAIEAARAFQAELLRGRDGRPFSDSLEILQEARLERSRLLT
jgi:hypothetical protein